MGRWIKYRPSYILNYHSDFLIYLIMINYLLNWNKKSSLSTSQLISFRVFVCLIFFLFPVGTELLVEYLLFSHFLVPLQLRECQREHSGADVCEFRGSDFWKIVFFGNIFGNLSSLLKIFFAPPKLSDYFHLEKKYLISCIMK
jgi:hypothetical protein